jgi:hypothetical protein
MLKNIKKVLSVLLGIGIISPIISINLTGNSKLYITLMNLGIKSILVALVLLAIGLNTFYIKDNWSKKIPLALSILEFILITGLLIYVYYKMNNFTGSFEFWKSFLNTKIVMSWGWIIMYLANTGLVLINFYENFKNKKTNIVEEIKEEEKTEE